MSRRIKDAIIRGYTRQPKYIRNVTDPIVLNRRMPSDFIERRAPKGKQIVMGWIRGKKRKRR